MADARRIIGFYRLRWIVEQLFRTTKTKGFDMEALRQQQGGPLEKLVVAILVAAVIVMQLVAERDGGLKRPLSDALDPGDQPVLERVSRSLEGKTEKQKLVAADVYLRIDFDLVLVTKVDWSDDDAEVGEDTSFICRKITIKYRPQLPDGTLGAIKSGGWEWQPAS